MRKEEVAGEERVRGAEAAAGAPEDREEVVRASPAQLPRSPYGHADATSSGGVRECLRGGAYACVTACDQELARSQRAREVEIAS